MERFAAAPKRVLVVHATYDLTFPLHLSLDVLENFNRCGIDYVSQGAAVRALHHGRDAVQVSGWVVSGVVCVPGVSGPAGRRLNGCGFLSCRTGPLRVVRAFARRFKALRGAPDGRK